MTVGASACGWATVRGCCGIAVKLWTMASTLLALIDDIATILDDVALLSKVAAQKTAGVLGDDLALNAQQVAGVSAERELPVVWAVCKGSLLNKVILVPAALLISIFIPWAVTPLLMVGGAYLCYDEFEKLAHKFLHSAAEDAAHAEELMHALANPNVDLREVERDKIKGAIRTDFVLSAEIIAITLGTVQGSRVDDAAVGAQRHRFIDDVWRLWVCGCNREDGRRGLVLEPPDRRRRSHPTFAKRGHGFVARCAAIDEGTGRGGSAAMFLVGGGILVHGLGPLHHAIEATVAAWTGAGDGLGAAALRFSLPLLADLMVGVVAGALVLLGVSGFQRLRPAA